MNIAVGYLEDPTQGLDDPNTAPVETEFVINGSGFGDIKGKVYFRDANVPEISMLPFYVEYVEINPQFIASWTNTEIILSAIPSKGYAKPGTDTPIDETGLKAIVGSGKIIVSSDGSTINKPSNCYFTLKDLPQLAQTAYLVSEQLVCSPNPFSSSMNVQFYLAQEEAVTLALYDLQGRLIKTIQSNEILAAGTHNITVESQNLLNGVYICSLITESRQLNEKVVLVR